MTEENLETILVRDRGGLRKLESVDAFTSTTLLATLSADPRSFAEFARAWLRYRPTEPLEELPWVTDCRLPPAAPWILLDLACLRIVSSGTEMPENPACYSKVEDHVDPRSPRIWINYPPEWQRVESADWADAQPPLPPPTEPLDFRSVLFGRALAEDIAERAVALARRGLPSEKPAESHVADRGTESAHWLRAEWHRLTVRIHADWLLTPRADLGGERPRYFLHDRRDWVERELENRAAQWSFERRPPRPLDRNTFAYRHGPCGRNEVVMYFEMCREVIQAAWNQLRATPDMPAATLADLLHEFAQWWLAESSVDDMPLSPSTIIDRERRRLPLDEGATDLDDDCVLCRSLEDGDVPAFSWFDGHRLELDDEFAFSLITSRSEWKWLRGV